MFKNRLVASCQDNPEWTIRMALQGGAGGLRVDGPDGLRLARKYGKVPVIACWKKDLIGLEVRITPHIDLAMELARGKAAYVAFDATNRKRLFPVKDMIDAIHASGSGVVADVSRESEAYAAVECGADYVATTLFGDQDYDAIRRMAKDGLPVIAEGNIRTPYEACLAREAGAELVCVGSAISRPHHVTAWFVSVLSD